MTIPPVWKIKRELRTALDQLKAWFLHLVSPIDRIFYDRNELVNIKINEGRRNLGKKIVLYLVYQPTGFVESNFDTIEHVISEGHEVLLVSNGSISVDDMNRLKPVCWRIIERMNLGYDFGGYRCGLNYLKQQNIIPDILTFLNDSIWFPIINKTDILERTERQVSDFGGAVCLDDSGSHKKGKLILSYWVTVRSALIQSNVFSNYWKNFLPSSNKILTVRFGEKGLSRVMNKCDRNIVGIYTLENFLSALQKATTHQLLLTLKYGSFTDPSFEIECQKIIISVDESCTWRKVCLEFIEKVSRRRNFLHSFCYPVIGIMKVPFIKKNQLRLLILMRLQYLRAVDSGDLPPPSPAMMIEIRKNTNIKNLI